MRQAFARRAKLAQLACGLIQREVAERIGQAQGKSAPIERGVQRATRSSLHAYVEALGCSPEWLMDTGKVIEPWPS